MRRRQIGDRLAVALPTATAAVSTLRRPTGRLWPSIGLRGSTRRCGNPIDNAHSRSFVGRVKCEEVYLSVYATFQNHVDRLSRFPVRSYPGSWIHSALGNLSPMNFEAAYVRQVA